jgi:hypothetical protein
LEQGGDLVVCNDLSQERVVDVAALDTLSKVASAENDSCTFQPLIEHDNPRSVLKVAKRKWHLKSLVQKRVRQEEVVSKGPEDWHQHDVLSCLHWVYKVRLNALLVDQEASQRVA